MRIRLLTILLILGMIFALAACGQSNNNDDSSIPNGGENLEEAPEGTPEETPEETPEGTPEGTPEEIFEHPKMVRTRQFLSCVL